MSAFPSIVNVPENLDFLIEFVNNPDFSSGEGEHAKAKRVAGPSFQTDEEYRQYYINKAKLEYLPDNETEMSSLVRNLKGKQRILVGLLEDLPKLLCKFGCLQLVIEGKYRKKADEEARRLDVHAQKVALAEQKRINAEKRYKAAATDWIGGKKEDDADKKEDELLEMKDQVARELAEGRRQIEAQQAALNAQQVALEMQIRQMQQSFLQQARDAETVRNATVLNLPSWPHAPVAAPAVVVHTARVPAPPPPCEVKPVSPKRGREEVEEANEQQMQNDYDELSRLFVDLPFPNGSADNDGRGG